MTKRNLVLPNAALAELAERITVQFFMTCREDFTLVDLGETIGCAKDKMDGNPERSFDQLPVTEGGRIVGLLRKSVLEGRDSGTLISECSWERAADCSIGSATTVVEVVERLCKVDAILVWDTVGDVCGLVHFSDLNKQAVRVYLYLWLSALEMGLAACLRPLPLEVWFKFLREQTQVVVLGRHALGIMNELDLDYVDEINLSDLIKVYGCMASGEEQLQIPKEEFKQKAQHLIPLRNSVMHPVRSVVSKRDDVNKLHQHLSDLKFLVAASQQALQRMANERQHN